MDSIAFKLKTWTKNNSGEKKNTFLIRFAIFITIVEETLIKKYDKWQNL